MYQDRVRAFWFLLFAVVIHSPLAVHAQDDEAVDSVLAAYVKSIGDVEALKSVQTFRTNSTLTTDSPLGELQIEIARIQSGEKYLETREIPDVGTIRTGFDGEVCWSIDPFQGAKVYKGEELEWVKATDNNLLPKLDWTEGFDGKIAYEGAEEIEGRPVHQLVFTPTLGTSTIRFFDKESGAISKSAISEVLPDGIERLTELVSSDYRSVDGISIAYKQVALTPEGTTIWVINSFELNVEIADDDFALPQEIRNLLKDQ